MIADVARPSVSLMIGLAAFLVVGGLVIWLLERRKGDRYTGRYLLVGLPGLYLAGLPAFGASRWLYIPGLSLLVLSQLVPIVIWRRRRASKNGQR